MEIVVIFSDIIFGLSQQNHDINTLVKLGTWQMRSKYLNSKPLVSKCSYVLIGLEIVRTYSRHFIEDVAQILLYFISNINLLLKQIKIIHSRVSLNINWSFFRRIHLIHIRYQDAVDLQSQFFFSSLAYGPHYLLGKSIVNIFFVIVHCNKR